MKKDVFRPNHALAWSTMGPNQCRMGSGLVLSWLRYPRGSVDKGPSDYNASHSSLRDRCLKRVPPLRRRPGGDRDTLRWRSGTPCFDPPTVAPKPDSSAGFIGRRHTSKHCGSSTRCWCSSGREQEQVVLARTATLLRCCGTTSSRCPWYRVAVSPRCLIGST